VGLATERVLLHLALYMLCITSRQKSRTLYFSGGLHPGITVAVSAMINFPEEGIEFTDFQTGKQL